MVRRNEGSDLSVTETFIKLNHLYGISDNQCKSHIAMCEGDYTNLICGARVSENEHYCIYHKNIFKQRSLGKIVIPTH